MLQIILGLTVLVLSDISRISEYANCLLFSAEFGHPPFKNLSGMPERYISLQSWPGRLSVLQDLTQALRRRQIISYTKLLV